MSKKFFYLSAALMASLLGSSCSQDDAPLFGEDGVTTFSITLPADMSSRAFNSGTKATNLYVAVYVNVSYSAFIESENVSRYLRFML